MRLQARWQPLVVLWERIRVQTAPYNEREGACGSSEGFGWVVWRLFVPVLGNVLLGLWLASRWRVCGACMWLVMLCLWL